MSALKVLFIDDSENDVILIVRELRKGFRDIHYEFVSTQIDVNAAFDKEWDVVLCDYNMPQMDPYLALQLMRKNGKEIPFIVISGAVGEEIAVDVMRAGAKDYLMKDALTRLIPAIQRCLEGHAIQQKKNEIQKELAESEAKLRVITDSAKDGIVMLDHQGRITFWNPAASEIFGMSANDVLGKNFHSMFVPEKYHEEFHEGFNRFHETGKGKLIGSTMVVQGLKQDQSIVPLEVSISAVQINGEWNSVGIIRDISERQRREEEFNRLAMAVEQASESIVITDTAGMIQYVNPAFEKISGYSRNEAVGKNPRFLKSGIYEEPFYSELWHTILSGQVWNGFITNKKKNGSFYEEEMTISPVRDHGGQIVNFVAVKYDVTLQRQMEKQLQQTRKMEAIGTLAAGIAHDFNNMLQGIIGYADIAMDSLPEQSRLTNYMEQILKAGGRAADLVRQILTFSRQTEQEKAPLLITPLIKESLKFLRASLPSTIEIKDNLSSACRPVLANQSQIHQIIMNLCTNAGYAMRKNGGILEVELFETVLDHFFESVYNVRQGTYLQLVVKDTGTGIPEEFYDKIFEPFFTTKPQGEGTGMGLSMVHGIVHNHGGTIVFESKVGQGSTFNIYLPIIENNYPEVEQDSTEVLTGSEHILVVDDEPTLGQLLQIQLAVFGYQVTVFQNSLEAFQCFSQSPQIFDLLITDLTMPNMTGDVLAEKILKIRPELPVILMSGFNQIFSQEQSKAIGIKSYLKKPFQLHKLGVLIRTILDDKKN
ncbi:MAG: PAS domain S-box protein [SAR324 cluster bacterium]|nr:PAS domain S-box protein [SAR324 cluster bacterium]